MSVGSIVICGILGVGVSGIVVSLIKGKKQGKSSCGCNCANCSGHCH